MILNKQKLENVGTFWKMLENVGEKIKLVFFFGKHKTMNKLEIAMYIGGWGVRTTGKSISVSVRACVRAEVVRWESPSKTGLSAFPFPFCPGWPSLFSRGPFPFPFCPVDFLSLFPTCRDYSLICRDSSLICFDFSLLCLDFSLICLDCSLIASTLQHSNVAQGTTSWKSKPMT